MQYKNFFLIITLCLLPTSIQATIVDPPWLKSRLTQENLLIVDVREPEDFFKGHVSGSVNLPPMTLFADSFLLPPISQLQSLFSNLGINHQQQVVVVGNHEFIWAARLYWILEFMGHQDVFFLDTAWGHWEEGLLPISEEASNPVFRQFVPRIDPKRLKTQLGTLAAIGHQPILDGRSKAHYMGETSGGAIRAGHIPTALHYPWTQNREQVDGSYRLRSLDDLSEIYKELPKDQEIILYCTGSAQAAMNYVVMQALGYRVAVYEGSWTEWGNNLSLPKVNLSKQAGKHNP